MKITRTIVRSALAALALAFTALLGATPGGADSLKAADPSWTGFYIGVVGGYDTQKTEVAGVLSFDASALSYGVAAGADYRIPGTGLVFGVMGDYLVNHASSAVANLDGTWSVLARGGFLISPSTLVYAGAGYTKLDASLPTSLEKGFTAALGAEVYLLSKLSARIEYRWVDLGDDVGSMAESSMQAIRLGLNYRF